MSTLSDKKKKMRCIQICLVVISLGIKVGQAQPLEITGMSKGLMGINLHWTSTAERYIVAQSQSLTTGIFDYVGAVLSTNMTFLTSSVPAAFYKIQEVVVVDFPDPALGSAISNAMVVKFDPANRFYDFEISNIVTLNAEGSGISNAVGLNGCTGLTLLDCSSNYLASLDVSGMGKLEELYCYANQITNLTLTGCTNLSALICMYNPLGTLDVTGMSSLSTLYCWNDELTNLNLTGCTNLSELIGMNNPLGTLDVSGMSSLSTLYCWNDELTNLNLTGGTNLALLACNDNLLPALDISRCYALTNLFCNNNNLSTLDISTCTNLTLVQCTGNSLVDIASFITNASRGGLGTGDVVYLNFNPLSQYAKTNQIPALLGYGVTVLW